MMLDDVQMRVLNHVLITVVSDFEGHHIDPASNDADEIKDLLHVIRVTMGLDNA